MGDDEALERVGEVPNVGDGEALERVGEVPDMGNGEALERAGEVPGVSAPEHEASLMKGPAPSEHVTLVPTISRLAWPQQ